MRRGLLRLVWIVAILLSSAACGFGQTSRPVSDVSVFVQEAETALEGGRPDVAIDKLRQALEGDPQSVEARFMLGNAYAQKAQFAQAEEQFLETLKLDHDNADVRSNLGVIYYRQGKLNKAEEAFRAALTLKKGDAEIHYNLGGVLAALNRFDDAVAEFLTAKEIDPSLPEPYLGLGSVYKLQGKQDEAVAVLKEYLKRSQDPSWRQQAEQMLREMESGQ